MSGLLQEWIGTRTKPWHVARFASAAMGLPLTDNERHLLSLKNKHAGKRCFIMGNGPSLRQTPVERLKNEVTIGCNGLFLMFDRMGFVPTFYTVEDVLVAEDRAAEINRIRGTTKVFPLDVMRFLPRDSDTVYVNFPRRYRNSPRFSDHFERVAYFGGTVTYLNLQLAYYIGASEIILIGVDHNYAKDPSKDDRSGYVITSRTDDPDHFHPGYFGPGYRFHDPQVDRMETAYRKAKEFLDAHGVRVRNATIGGKLEVFERIEFGKLF